MCLHYDHKNPKFSYVVKGDTIKSMLECTDLGIMRSANFDYCHQFEKNLYKGFEIISHVIQSIYFTS